LIFGVHGRLRYECLDEHWFISLAYARVVIEAWRQECNEERSKRILARLTPDTHHNNWLPERLQHKEAEFDWTTASSSGSILSIKMYCEMAGDAARPLAGALGRYR
jgi:hypothetical protein